MTQRKFLVYRGRRHIDTVYFTPDCTAEYVRLSLINHDGYPADIRVFEEARP